MSLNRILIVADNPVRDYSSRIHAGVQRVASTMAYRADIENSRDTGRTVEAMIEGWAGGGVILTAPYSDDRSVLSLLESRGIAYVRVAPMVDSERGSTVTIDEFDAARVATDFMLEQGHRRVAIIRGSRQHLVSMRRYNGYAAALGGRGLRVDPSLVFQGDFSRESGRDQAAAIFAARPTAVFASNDDMAVGLIEAATAAGVSIPRDISLVGFDDNAVAKTCRPRLTTIRQPLEEMGEAAAKLLIDRLRNPGRGPAHTTVPFDLVQRESVSAVAA